MSYTQFRLLMTETGFFNLSDGDDDDSEAGCWRFNLNDDVVSADYSAELDRVTFSVDIAYPLPGTEDAILDLTMQCNSLAFTTGRRFARDTEDGQYVLIADRALARLNVDEVHLVLLSLREQLEIWRAIFERAAHSPQPAPDARRDDGADAIQV